MLKRIIKRVLPQSVVNEIKIRRQKIYPINQTQKQREDGVKDIFKRYTGNDLDFSNPKTYSEKIQWLKLYYEHPDLSKIVCKYNFKKYIAKKIGDGYTVPLYGVWSDVKKINFDKLPDKFVLKSNCSSNGNFIKIVKDKNTLDMNALRQELTEWLNPQKTMIRSYCRAYWKVRPLIIAEEYIEQLNGQAYDYKFFCFHGVPKFAYVATDHFENGENIPNHNISVYNLDWERMNVQYGDHPQNNIPAPKNLEKMIELSRTVSKEFPFVRVDFFEIDDRVYFSELTFYPGGGLNIIKPVEIDEEWGSYIDFSNIKTASNIRSL